MTGTIAILGGTGKQGSGLARRFARAGARVLVGSRDAQRARETVAGWPPPQPSEADPTVTRGSIEGASNAEAVAAADTVVLAVPFSSVADTLHAVGGRWRSGAVLVDVTVPLSFEGGKLTVIPVAEGSAAEHVRARLPGSIPLAGAFKTLPAHLLNDVDAAIDCDEFVCADSDASRSAAFALVRLLPGVRAIDVGPLARARAVEHLTALAVAINRRHKVHDARFRVVGL
jgi:NADPH-dependent F420 reductase